MRAFSCDHCGALEKISFGNRRPVGWATIRVDRAVQESGPRHAVARETGSFELCSSCYDHLRVFLTSFLTSHQGDPEEEEEEP